MDESSILRSAAADDVAALLFLPPVEEFADATSAPYEAATLLATLNTACATFGINCEQAKRQSAYRST